MNTKTSRENTIFIIDGSAYIHRAFHAIRNLSNSKGFPTNAVFGFTRTILKLLETYQPVYAAMLFDAKGPTFRHAMYDRYKANRPKMADELAVQIPWIKETSKAFNLPVIEMQGFEADDLAGTLALKAQENGLDVVLVTGDKDFAQLVTDRVMVWDPMKEKETTTESIRKELGITPGQVIDMMALTGDTSDNIPGVPGIGPKTAVTLIQAFGDLDTLYEKVDTITKKKQKENLVNNRDNAFLSRDLVRIKTDVPLDFEIDSFRLTEPDNAALSKIFKEMEFRQLQEKFPVKADLSRKNYKAILTETDLEALVKKLETAEIFALDTETTSTNPMVAQLVGFSFAVKEDEAFYLPCRHTGIDAPRQINIENAVDALKPVLENPGIKKIGQNIKYDWMVLKRHGIDLAGVSFDTMLASYLINPGKRSHSLDQIALDLLDHKTIKYEDVAGKGKNALRFDEVPLREAVPYACEDADITLMAYNILSPMLEKEGLVELFEKVEMPLIPVLMDMEMTGIHVDEDSLRELSKSIEFELAQIEKEIYSQAGETFNINSSQQLGKILFETLELPVQKKTKKKTGYSTDVEVLTALSDHHELPALVLRHRTLAKLKSTYTDTLVELLHPETKRIHTSYNQTVTATGRLSSSDPNLQNIPVKTEEGRRIRSAFIPREGWTLLAADYSQIELRILAHCADDRILIEAFEKEEDIHTRTAAEVFQVFPSFITPELRRQAKAINFGIIYGQSAYGLSRDLGISRKMAQTYIDNYFKRYSGVKKFIEQTIETARETKQTETLLGRIRPLPDIASSNRTVRSFAERIAVNTPIQGTAADLIKLAMIRMHDALKEKKMKTKMLLTVHDELVFEVPPEEIESARKRIREVMENVWDMKVPLKVNIDEGKNWAEAH